jgi:hypothetical protein
MAVVYSGGTYVNTTFTGDSKSVIMANLLTQLVNAGWTNVAYIGGLGFADQTFTVTIASPGVVSLTAHGLSANDTVVLKTTGTLPTGLTANTKYFVRNPAANTFELSASSGGASINTSVSQSGVHKVTTESILLQSATQSGVTNPCRIRMKDNLGTCVDISLENSAGTLASTNTSSAGGSLLPAASQTMRIIATKYWGICIVPGSTLARTFVYFGMPYLDSSILSSVTDIGMMFSNTVSEGSTNVGYSIRTAPVFTGLSNGTQTPNYVVIYNTSMVQNNNGSNAGSNSNAGAPECIYTTSPATAQTSTARNYRWASDALLTSDVLIAWGLTFISDEAKIRGQLYDMIYIAEAVAMDATDTFSGHSWFNITNNGTQGNSYPRGGMWVRTDT